MKKFLNKIKANYRLSTKQTIYLVASGVALALIFSIFILPLIRNHYDKVNYIQSLVSENTQGVTFPAKLDDYTTWNDLVGTSDRLIYTYTLEGLNNNEQTRALITENVSLAICANQESLEILENEVTLEYRYNLVGGDPITKVLTRGDCS